MNFPVKRWRPGRGKGYSSSANSWTSPGTLVVSTSSGPGLRVRPQDERCSWTALRVRPAGAHAYRRIVICGEVEFSPSTELRRVHENKNQARDRVPVGLAIGPDDRVPGQKNHFLAGRKVHRRSLHQDGRGEIDAGLQARQERNSGIFGAWRFFRG